MSLESLNEKERRAWDAAEALAGEINRTGAQIVGVVGDTRTTAAVATSRLADAFAALKPQPLVWRAHVLDYSKAVRSDGAVLHIEMPSQYMRIGDVLLAALNRYEREKVER